MATMIGGLLGKLAGRGTPAKVAPTQTAGVPGFAHFGGYIASPERRPEVQGLEKWRNYADVVTNFSIVAAGTRHFLGLIARTEWQVEPAGDPDESGEFQSAAQEMADFVEHVMFDMDTSWAKVCRRASMYRFNGFGVQEWTAKRIVTGDFVGRIGFADIAPRPCHTIQRWEIDPDGTIKGMWQNNPLTGKELFLPREKVIYLVDDSLTDNPEGLGLFRHLIEPVNRLVEYLRLEGTGFQRDLRGIPVGRAPLTAIEKSVAAGDITREFADRLIHGLEDLVKMQAKSKDSGIILDSQPFESQTADGVNVSSAPQWAIDLITGNATGMDSIANAINRINREMARILGVEQLMLGEGSGSRSLSEDKTSSFFMLVEGALADIAEGYEKDLIDTLWKLNGFDPALKPTLRYESVQFKDVAKITAALRDMATAGATLAPDDKAIDDVRDLLGISRPPELDPEMVEAMNRLKAGLPDPNAPEADPNSPEALDEDE